MSRRASVFARQNPGRRRVRFPDEIVFEESIKESDAEDIMCLLRRASVDIDVDRINMAGMTALHQAVLDNNIVVVKILVHHGALIDKADIDSWTALHAAVANGHHEIVKFLISQGASKNALTDEGERPIDLVDPNDQMSLQILLAEESKGERDRRMSLALESREPAWFRRESIRFEDLRRESFNNIRGRKGSMWNSSAVDEEDEEDYSDCEEEEARGTSSEEETNRASVAVSDLRKMATSMNRSQFNSAVLGKDSAPETEPSGESVKKPGTAACGSSFADRYLANEVTKRLSLLEKTPCGNSAHGASSGRSSVGNSSPTTSSFKSETTEKKPTSPSLSFNKRFDDKGLNHNRPISPLAVKKSELSDDKYRPRSPLFSRSNDVESKLSSSPLRPISPLVVKKSTDDKISSSKYSPSFGSHQTKSKLYNPVDAKLGSTLLPDKYGGNKQFMVKSDTKMSVKDKLDHMKIAKCEVGGKGDMLKSVEGVGKGKDIKFSFDKSGCDSLSTKGADKVSSFNKSPLLGSINRLTKVSTLLDRHESAVKASKHQAADNNSNCSSPTSSPKLSGNSNRVAALSRRFDDGSSSPTRSSSPSSRTLHSEAVLGTLSSTPTDISSKRATFNLKTEMASKRASINSSSPRTTLTPSSSPSLAPKIQAARNSSQNAAEPLDDDVNSMLENWRKKRQERRER